MKFLFALLLIAFGYAGAGAFTELSLIKLLRSPEAEHAQPVSYLEDGKEHSFHDRLDMEIYQKEKQRNKLFPWARNLEEWMALGVLAAACGYAGGYIRLFMEAQTNVPLHQNSPFIGLVLAVALTLLAAGGDALMLEGDLHFRPTAVAVICLLSGVAWEHAWAFLKKKGEKTL
jgi:hypothetical protein